MGYLPRIVALWGFGAACIIVGAAALTIFVLSWDEVVARDSGIIIVCVPMAGIGLMGCGVLGLGQGWYLFGVWRYLAALKCPNCGRTDGEYCGAFGECAHCSAPDLD